MGNVKFKFNIGDKVVPRKGRSGGYNGQVDVERVMKCWTYINVCSLSVRETLFGDHQQTYFGSSASEFDLPENEFELFQEPPAPKFKMGDRVRVKGPCSRVIGATIMNFFKGDLGFTYDIDRDDGHQAVYREDEVCNEAGYMINAAKRRLQVELRVDAERTTVYARIRYSSEDGIAFERVTRNTIDELAIVNFQWSKDFSNLIVIDDNFDAMIVSKIILDIDRRRV